MSETLKVRVFRVVKVDLVYYVDVPAHLSPDEAEEFASNWGEWDITEGDFETQSVEVQQEEVNA